MDMGRMMLGGGMEGGPNRTMLLELGSQDQSALSPNSIFYASLVAVMTIVNTNVPPEKTVVIGV